MSDIWENAINLNLNTPLTGTWTAATNDYQFAANTTFTGIGQTATTATGADVVYRFTAPTAGTYSLRVTAPTSAPDIVLYALNSIPATTPGTPLNINPANVLKGANRNSSSSAPRAEEVYNLSLSANQTIYLVADLASGTSTSGFTVEVNPTVTETESNNTPATANPLVFGIEGSTNQAGDVDYYSLGTPASGSRVFAFIDGLAQSSGSSSDFDLRVTTATDTLEYDDFDGDPLFGQSGFNPSIAGTPLTGVPSYLQVVNYNSSATSEPYRLYAVVQPGIANATVETEGNNTLITANTASNNYFSGALSSTTDIDYYSFAARAGDLVFLSLDADPLRNNTPFDGRLALLDSTNAILVNVNGSNASVSTGSGAGSLTSSSPDYPSEGLVYRIRTDGTYYARVNAASTSIGDYLLSISVNGNIIIQGTSGADTLTGTLNNDIINGLDGSDRLIGQAGNDTLDGGADNDYVFGGLGNDIITGGTGNDYLYGEAGNDTINGGDGNDNLNGGAGNDILNGGLGYDIYTVDAGDTITENTDEGIDTVNADFTYTLGNNFENLTLTGNAVIDGTGNELNNQIFGNNAVNTLNGGDGDDWLLGKGGNDILNGGAGNDRLDGGLGDDRLTGGLGNDLYQVDSSDDVIIEDADAGTDTVSSSVTWTLGNNLENLTLIGSQTIDGTGNSSNNRLQGNAADNILFGLGGNDYLAGNNGDDTLIGGLGNDTLVGGSGEDDFDFAGTLTGGFDTVLDFNLTDDLVLLSGDEFGLTQAPGVLDAASFVLGSSATNATQRFIYNQTQGSLWFDSDGNGSNAAVQIASFSNRVALTNVDFEVTSSVQIG